MAEPFAGNGGPLMAKPDVGGIPGRTRCEGSSIRLLRRILENALLACLYVAWKKFRLLIDLLDGRIEDAFERGRRDFRFLADGDSVQSPFRNVNADVDLIALEQRPRRVCWAREITRATSSTSTVAAVAPALAVHESALLRTRVPRSCLHIFPADCRAAFSPARLRLLVSRCAIAISSGRKPRCSSSSLCSAFFSLQAIFSNLLRRCRAAALRRDPFGERVIALKIQMRACLVGLLRVEIGLAASMSSSTVPATCMS